MKKFVSLMLVLCLVGLSGCTTAADEPEKSAAASSEYEIKTYPLRMEDFADEFDAMDARIISDDVSDLEESKIYTFAGKVESVELPDESNKNLGSITLNMKAGKIIIFVPVALVMDTTGCSFTKASLYFPMPEKEEYCFIYASYHGCTSGTNEMIASYGGLGYQMGVMSWIEKMYTHENDNTEEPNTETTSEPVPEPASNPQPEPSPAPAPTSTYTVENLKKDLDGILGDGGTITSVSLENRSLKIAGTLSSSVIPEDALVRTNASTITDEILEHNDFDSEWDTIQISFPNHASIIVGKGSIRTNEFGGRYMDSSDF